MSHRKILHAADIHLDSPLQKLGSYEHAPVDRIRLASRCALENMVQLALDQAVDLVVIAGDLYDGDWPDQNTGLFFVAQANRLVKAGIPMAVIRGNHDAANLMTSSLPLPRNPDGSEIMFASECVDLRQFDPIGIVVHGRSFRTRAETENLAADYPAPINGMFNVGLLHTSLTGAEGHDPYAPCTPAQLSEKNYDYWALGHVHARRDYGMVDAAPIVFSGNIQGRHIREPGPKGCIVVDIDGHNNCTHTFHELDVVRWELCTIDTSAMQHTDEAIDAFQAWLVDAIADAGGRLLVVRVQLIGATSLHHAFHRRINQLKGSFQATAVTHGCDQVWFEDLKIRTAAQSSAEMVDLEGPMESLSVVIDQLRHDPDVGGLIEHEVRGLIKKLPVELSGDEQPLLVDDPGWIDELIESASAEVLSRLQLERSEP